MSAEISVKASVYNLKTLTTKKGNPMAVGRLMVAFDKDTKKGAFMPFIAFDEAANVIMGAGEKGRIQGIGYLKVNTYKRKDGTETTEAQIVLTNAIVAPAYEERGRGNATPAPEQPATSTFDDQIPF